MLIREMVCYACQHYWGANKCKAFPQGIPQTVVNGENTHERAIEGDKGLRYFPRKKK